MSVTFQEVSSLLSTAGDQVVQEQAQLKDQNFGIEDLTGSNDEKGKKTLKAPRKKKKKKGKQKSNKKEKRRPKPKPEVQKSETEITSIPGSTATAIDIDAEFKKMYRNFESSEAEHTPSLECTPSQSLSAHSASSKEDVIKKCDESLGDEFNFDQALEFCLAGLESNHDIPNELCIPLKTLLHKYHESLDKSKNCKDKAEADLVNIKTKMFDNLQQANEMQDEIKVLKTKIESSETYVQCLKKELDESHEREHDLIDEVTQLEEQIRHLDSDLEKRRVEDQLREQGLDLTAKTRDGFTKEIIRLKQDLELSESRLHLTLEDLQELHKKYKEKEEECAEMEEILKNEKYEKIKELQNAKMLEADLARVTDEMRHLKVTLAKHYETFKNASQELMKKDEEVYELRKNLRQTNKQNETMVKLTSELKERLEYSVNKYFKLETEYKNLKAVCSSQTGDLTLISKKSQDVEKSQEKWLKRVLESERRRNKAMKDAKRFFSQIKDMSYEAKKTRLVIVKLNRSVSSFKKENIMLLKQMKNLQGVVDEQKKNSDEQQTIIAQLTEETNKLTNENLMNTKTLNIFLKTKEKEMKDRMLLKQSYEKLKVDFSNCSIENTRLLKEIHDKIVELKQIENLFNAATMEKKYLSKRLLEAQGQIKDLQNKCNFIFQELELVKDQFNKKQQDYEKLQTSNRKDVFTKDAMTTKLDHCLEHRKNLLNKLDAKETELKQQVDVMIKKETLIKELEIELEMIKRQTGDLKTVIQKRGAELSLVYEKIDLMNYILSNGEEQYQQRLKDIELLKREVKKLRADKLVLVKLAENTPNLRQEMFHLHKDLSRERQKCRALEEQMENPLNIHRWRILQARDPERKDLIEKNQMLQKRLIKIEQDNANFRDQSENIEMLYLNMRTYLNKLPGLDGANHLEEARRLLREKTRENKALAALLGAYENELADFKKKMEQIQNESRETKEKFYDMKRKYDVLNQGQNSKNSLILPKTDPRKKHYPCGFGLVQL